MQHDPIGPLFRKRRTSQPDPYRIINRVEEYGSTKAIFRHVAKLGIPELLFFTLSRGSSSPNWMAAMGTTTRSLVKVERPVSDFESGRLLLMIDEGRFRGRLLAIALGLSN